MSHSIFLKEEFLNNDVVWYWHGDRKRYGQIHTKRQKGETPTLYIKWLDGNSWVTLDLHLKDMKLRNQQLFKG